jgi:hypothetical protein
MTRNPYAQMGNFGDQGRPDGPDYFGGQVPTRTSALAVASLIVSIVSLLVCCIPGPGVLGMLLALGAVISITTSGGRRTGMGMAIAGLLLGLVASIIAVVIWSIVAAGLSGLGGHRDTLEAIWQRDVTTAAQSFEPATAAKITPERLDAFVADIEAEMGAYKSVPKGVGPFWLAYQDIQFGAPAFQILSKQGYTGSSIPLPAEFDNGYTTVLLELVPGANMGGGPAPRLRNLGVALPSGRIVWLDDSAAPSTLPPAPTAPTTPATPDGAPPPEEAPEPAAPEPRPDAPDGNEPPTPEPAPAPDEPTGGR